jgi:uncharacterized membrane protein
MAMYQKVARFALLASVALFILTLPLSLIVHPAIGVRSLLALGVVLLLVFVVFGNLCDGQNEDKP